MFDEMSPLDVVWDDGLLHGLDCHEELVQQALFDECLHVDDTSTVDLMTLLAHGSESFLKEVDLDTTDKLFNNLPHEVVWDEEIEYGVNSHGLLQHIALSTDYLDSKERKPTTEELNSSDMATAGNLFTDMPLEVKWDEEPHHGFDSHGLLQQHAEVMDNQMQGKQKVFDEMPSVVVWDDDMIVDQNGESHVVENDMLMVKAPMNELLLDTSVPIFLDLDMGKEEVSVEILSESVLWDAIPADIETHLGLLQKLTQSGDCCDERKLSLEPAISNSLTHVNDHFSVLAIGVDSRRSDAVLDEDMLSDHGTHCGLLQLLACCKQCMNDELNQDRDILFLLGLGMDHADEMSASPSSFGMNEGLPYVPETHGSLLQQVAWDMQHFAYEMRKPIAEIALEYMLADVGNLTVNVDSSMHVSDQLCKFALVINIYLVEMQYKKAYISISQWNPGIWRKGTTAHQQQQLEICWIFGKQWDPGILKWLRNLFELQSGNGEDLNGQGMIPVNDIFNALPAGYELNFGTVTLIIYDGWQGAIGLQVIFAELHPCHHNVFISTKLGTMCYRYNSDVVQLWSMNGFSPVSCELNRQSVLIATNLQFSHKAFKSVIWRNACWLTEEILPEISHASVSKLASEETDNILFQIGDFRRRESEKLELYMITLIQCDLGLVEVYKSNYRCPADTRLIQWDLGPACQMVLAATKWRQEHCSPGTSNSDHHRSEKMSHSNANVFSPRDGVQQHFRIVKRLCCSTKQYDLATNLLCWMNHPFERKVQDRISYNAKSVGGKIALHGKLLLGSVESYQHIVLAHLKPKSLAQLCITIHQYSSIGASSCLHHLWLKETYSQLHDAFAWGQAKFRGGGNVTPRIESKESSALIDKWVHQPWDPGGREDKFYILPSQRKGESRQYSEK